MTDISSSTNGRPSSSESAGPRTDLLSPDPTDRTRAEPIFQGDVDTEKTVVVCGAGGFIGGHLVADLLRQGYSEVRAVDIKPPNQWFQKFPQVEGAVVRLREFLEPLAWRLDVDGAHLGEALPQQVGHEVAADEPARAADDDGLVCVHVALKDRFGTGPVCGIRGQEVRAGASFVVRSGASIFGRRRHIR